MVLLVIRMLLAAVLAAAAVTKAAAPRRTREGLDAFGVPRRLLGVAAVGLPAAELAVATALLPARSAAAGLAGAVSLIAVFTAAVGWQLARGRRPACACFGAATASPIGPSTLVRNGALLGLAVAAAAAGWSDAGPGPGEVLGEPLAAAVAGLSLLAVVQGTLFVALLRRHGRLLASVGVEAEPEPEPAGLPVGSEAPEFALPDAAGAEVTLAGLRARGLPVLLLFTDPACAPCQALLPEVGGWQERWSDEVVLAVVSNADPEEVRAEARRHGLGLALAQEAHAVGLAYGALATPAAVLVDPDGRIASPVVTGEGAIVALVAEALVREGVDAGVR